MNFDNAAIRATKKGLVRRQGKAKRVRGNPVYDKKRKSIH